MHEAHVSDYFRIYIAVIVLTENSLLRDSEELKRKDDADDSEHVIRK